MNLKQHFTPSGTLRFRRWSRKGYAAFASLGRCVTIGRVCKSITERSLAKQVAPSTPCHTKQMKTGRDNDPPTIHRTIIELLLAAILPQIVTTRPASCGYPYIHTINRGRAAQNASYNSILHHEEHNELQEAFCVDLPLFPHIL